MSVYPIEADAVYRHELSPLRLVETPELAPGTIQFEDYMALRQLCNITPKLEVSRVTEIQEKVRSWLTEHAILPEVPDYAADYSEETIHDKIGGLVNYLRENFGDEIPAVELDTTDAFVDSAFTMYGERSHTGRVHDDSDGSFAFVVPVRLSRERPEYGKEVEGAIPAFRYLPNELRADMLVGLPPLIIDRYERAADGKQGYIVMAPIYTDNLNDMEHSPRATLKIARPKINDAVDFAQERLGVEIVALGAVIPALTNYGKSVTNTNVIVTNGHGGTAYIVKETVRAAVENNLVSADAIKKIGMLGLGSIGYSIAHLIASEFPGSELRVFDTSANKVDRVLKTIQDGNIIAAKDGAELIDKSDIIISAIVGQIDLQDEAHHRINMKDKLVVDDGQPAAFDRKQVTARDALLTWPIGHDTLKLIVRNDFDYGTMYDSKRDLFGCEAEGATLALYAQDMRNRGLPDQVVRNVLEKVAICSAVTPRMARLMGVLFRHKSGVGVAYPQAFGYPVTAPGKKQTKNLLHTSTPASAYAGY